MKRRDALKLGAKLKKLRGRNLENTKEIKIVWADDFGYWSYKKYFNEEKIIELLKGWVLYCNAKVKYKKIRFNQYDKFSFF